MRTSVRRSPGRLFGEFREVFIVMIEWIAFCISARILFVPSFSRCSPAGSHSALVVNIGGNSYRMREHQDRSPAVPTEDRQEVASRPPHPMGAATRFRESTRERSWRTSWQRPKMSDPCARTRRNRREGMCLELLFEMLPPGRGIGRSRKAWPGGSRWRGVVQDLLAAGRGPVHLSG